MRSRSSAAFERTPPNSTDTADDSRIAAGSRRIYRGHPEILFWLLLLGSWQFLSAGGNRNGAIGAVGAMAFSLFAAHSLGKLTAMGFNHAAWRPVPGRAWLAAAALGILLGVAIYGVGVWTGSAMSLSADWKLIVLQVGLGPVVEEIIFRGYLIALLRIGFRWIENARIANSMMVATAAVLFSIVHVAQPGGGWLQFWCIAATGTVYGVIRLWSGSTASAAVAHSAYNLTLYAVGWVSLYLRG